jgi:hypothetical protein
VEVVEELVEKLVNEAVVNRGGRDGGRLWTDDVVEEADDVVEVNGSGTVGKDDITDGGKESMIKPREEA